MLDFVSVKATSTKKYTTDIYPEFLVKKSKDLMIKGKAFYAVWDEDTGLWSKDEDLVQKKVDQITREFADNYETSDKKVLKLLANFSSNKWTEWQKYCKSLPDNYIELDENVTFANSEVKKTDYVSKRLPYALEEGPIKAYEELISTLYDPEERRKLEWAVGAVLTGDSKWIQKFIVLYGAPGSGKSTWLNILQKLVEGYYSVFESKALASSNNAFALEAFRSNPLVAIQHDGDLSRIEDNTKLNSIVSHESLIVNEKFKATYSSKFNSFIFMGTNKPVKITDAKSGIIRRLIDVIPSGRKIPRKKFDEIMHQINFELGAIAYHCIQVYRDLGPSYYDGYLPISMMASTNDFYNFVEDNYDFFVIDNPEGVTLNTVWLRYKEYCQDANVAYPYSKRLFKDELKNYFEEYYDRKGNLRSVYVGFKTDKFEYKPLEKPSEEYQSWLIFKEQKSLLDDVFADSLAQYANEAETPNVAWRKCKTVLRSLDTRKLHYLKPDDVKLVVVDFDLKDDDGYKCFEKNLEAARKWPQTYAELSKSGEGIHLHYWYDGDPSELARVFDEDIEIKVFTGLSSLRRMLTKCNDIPIATIKVGSLPVKGGKKVVSEEVVKSERALRDLIERNLNKEIHANTTQSINFIYQILEDAYEQGLKYDVTDMRNRIQVFALNSTHQAEHCIRMVSKMKFASDEPADGIEGTDDRPIVFYDVEVFPNLFLVVWKKEGPNAKKTVWFNPAPEQMTELRQYRLIGFNNRKYDNHMIYAREIGYTPLQIFELSQRIIVDGDRDAFFGNAYNLSYTDIYDFMSAGNKMSLKKWEIKLGIHHQELGLPWDKPLAEDKWKLAGEYCCNDVDATEATWNYPDVQADWLAREILADLSGLTVNDTTNQHTIRIIVGNDPNPQSQFIYTDLSEIFPGYKFSQYGIDKSEYNEGTKIVAGKSIYRGEDPGEGGYVYSEPGMYANVALLDVASMHPHSLIRLKLFGEIYTMRFQDIVNARILIKHKEYDKAKHIMDGKLAKYLDDPSQAKKLANALKTAINSVYGLTSAKFPNKLRDPRNKDNIVAKYGALFMINLKHEVQQRGFTVVHIKTDSIKIANATPEIIEFVMNYGKEYGYTFEHEATYAKMCIVNEAVYIAQYALKDTCENLYGYIPGDNYDHEAQWTATGTQFQIPYVFKTLFSKEPIQFEDMCETKSVSSSLYLDFNENLDPDEHDYRFVGKVGSFCPIKPGYGAGVLLRESGENKFAAATGTKKPGKIPKGEPDVYYWMEAEMVRTLDLKDAIDRSYYDHLVDEAVETIAQYGDAERFMSGDLTEDLSWLNVPAWVPDDVEELPFRDESEAA